MRLFKRDKQIHKKKGFVGIEYVVAAAIVLIGCIGYYANSQETIKNTHEEGSILMSDDDAVLQTTTGSSGGDLVSAITLSPDLIYLENIGDTGTSTVKLTPDTSWRIGLKWEPFFNSSYTTLTEENSGYRVVAKGLQKGVSKYKVTTTDGSTASKQLVVQVGQPSEFTVSPSKPTIDEDSQITLTVANSDDEWSNITVESWEIMSGGDLISVATSADKRSAVVSADGPANGGVASIKITVADENFGIKHEVYAQITVNKDYFTTFDTNKGSGTYNQLKSAATRTVSIPENYKPSRTGYTFTGWKLSIGGDIYQPTETYKMPAQNNTMTAQWNAVNYPVIFDLNYDGKRHSSLNLAYESKLGSLPEPTRNGCTFEGWYTSAIGGVKITSETTVPLGGATYYAHWSFNDYTVNYDLNGGAGTFPSVRAKYSSTIQLSTNIPTRQYYKFTGWTSSFDGKTYGAGVKYTIPYQNVTMKANWQAEAYSITYVTNGGTISGTPVTSYKTTDTVTLPSISRTGYTFGGWYESSSFTGTKVTVLNKGTGGNKTFYAKWIANTYTLSFNANGGSVSPSSKTVTYGSPLGNLPTPSRTGYTFTGWYTATSGGSKWTADTAYQTTGNSTVYARWTANVYTITFNGNGGTPNKSTMTVTYGSKIGSGIATASRDYYQFDGWYTASSGGTRWTADTVYNIAGNTTVYAHWTALYATVVVNNDITGDTTTHNIQYGTSKDVGALSAAGYDFKSYSSTNSSIATVSGTTISVSTVGSVTIRSNWTMIHPGSSGFAVGDWSCSTRNSTQNASATSNARYYTVDSGDTSCPNSGANVFPDGYASHGTNRTQSRGNTRYICSKVCDSSGNNYDGTNRCSSATATWIGAATSVSLSTWAPNNVGTGGYNINHQMYNSVRGNVMSTIVMNNWAYSWPASSARSTYASGENVYKIWYDRYDNQTLSITNTEGYHVNDGYLAKMTYLYYRSARLNHAFTGRAYGCNNDSGSSWA